MSELSAREGIPYPGRTEDPFYDAFKAMVNAMDIRHYASREDRNLLLTGGGTFSFVIAGPIGTLSFTADLDILSATTGFLEAVLPTSIELEDGEFFYVNLVRAPLTEVVLGIGIATSIPSGAPTDSFVLGVRKGTRVIFRTGAVLNDGDSIAIFEAGSTISLSGSVPSTIQAGSVGSAGVGTTASRGDHSHPVNTAGAGDLAAVNAAAASAGVSTKIPRADHKHQVSVGSAVAQVVGAGTDGVATSVSRSDHVHPLASAVPLATNNANVEGAATSVSRSDHRHRLELVIMQNGVPVGAPRPKLNFMGDVVISDDVPGDKLDITIGAGGTFSTYNCPSGVAVRDIVYISGSNAVDKANATSLATMSAIGIVVSKPTSTTAEVLISPAEVGGFAGLTPGAAYYVDTAVSGGLTLTPPNVVGQVNQRVGRARNATTMLVQLGEPTVI